MALFRCPECGKEVSDRAEVCPNCGYPVENNIETSQQEIEAEKEYIGAAKDGEKDFKTEVKHRKKIEFNLKHKKVVIAIIIILALIICLMAYFTVDYRAYQSAVANYNAQQYDIAILAFEDLGNYLDSKDYLLKSYYEGAKTAYGEKNYDIAIEYFRTIIDYEDSQVLYNQSIYDKAQEMMDAEQYEDAAKLFAEIENFKDAKVKSEKCEFEASVDGSFLRDLVVALQARWEKVDNADDATTDMALVEQNAGYIDTEMSILSEYKYKQFKDNNIKEYFNTYLEALENQKKALDYVATSNFKYVEKWTEASGTRYRVIYLLNEEYGLEFEDEYQEHFQEFLYLGRSYEQEATVEEVVKKMVAADNFKKVSSRGGTEEYEAIIENVTDVTFEYFNIEVRLYDDDNVIIDTKYCGSISNFEPGAKAKFDFSIYGNSKPAKIETIPSYTIG